MSDTACVLCGEDWDTDHIRHEEPLYVQKLYFAGKGCPTCTGKRQRKKSVANILHVGHEIMKEEGEVADRLAMLGDGRDELDYRKEWDAAQEDFVVNTCEGCGDVSSFAADDIYGLRDDDGKLVEGVVIWHDTRYGIGDRQRVSIKDLVKGTVANGRSVDLTHFDDAWDYEEIHGKTVCMKCRSTCDGQTAPRLEWRDQEDGQRIWALIEEAKPCEERLFKGEALSKFVGDTYDPGSSFYVQELGRFGREFCSDCFERLPNCGNCGRTWDFDDEPAIFVEGDDYNCEHCTSWKKCDMCDQWAEVLSDNGECSACAAENETEDENVYELKFIAACGMKTYWADDLTKLDARDDAARMLRNRRNSDHPVSILERGESWEVGEPEGCMMIPDTAGILYLMKMPERQG